MVYWCAINLYTSQDFIIRTLSSYTGHTLVRRADKRTFLWLPVITPKYSQAFINSTCSCLRSWHWRRHQPDPDCGRGILMTLSASSKRAQLKNSFTISTGSGQMFKVEQQEDGALPFLDTLQERMAAWMSVSTGSPCNEQVSPLLSPIIRPMWREVWWDVSTTGLEGSSTFRTTFRRKLTSVL